MVAMFDRLMPPPPQRGDAVAAASVMLILLPQVLAYSELAGMPPHLGLIAAAFPPIVAAIFASSPYLQTGPTALTALLVFGALQPLATAGTDEYIRLGALLALYVGLARIAMGLLRLGVIAYFLSQPVLTGFSTGAAILICASQVPNLVGIQPSGTGVLARAIDVVTQYSDWSWTSVLLGTATLGVIFGLRKARPSLPSVLIAVALAWLLTKALNLDVGVVGEIPSGLPTLSLDLPFSRSTELVVPALIIALIGFAEPASIARTYAAEKRERWSANQEFVSQGAANVASALSGAFPVGGSFGRSSLNVAAGAQTRWSGFLTGVLVLAVLPFAQVLSSIPSPALAAVVIAAALKLIRVDRIRAMWAWSRPQALSAAATLTATLALDPRIDRAIILGVAISVGVHLWRELHVYVDVEICSKTELRIVPHGVLWFGSATRLSQQILDTIAYNPDVDHVQISLQGIGRLDMTAATELAELSVDARRTGVTVDFEGIPPHAERLFCTIIQPDSAVQDC